MLTLGRHREIAKSEQCNFEKCLLKCLLVYLSGTVGCSTLLKMERFKVRKKKAQSDHSVSKILKDYCENCSGHGFQYWVADSSVLEKLFWVAVVLFFFTSGAAMVNEAVTHWSVNPDVVEITSFSKKATDLIHPAITICNPNGYDVGEYLRAVFDNFEYSNIDASETLRSHFPGFSDVNSKLV